MERRSSMKGSFIANGVGPLSKKGLNKAFGLTVSSRAVGSGEAMFDTETSAGCAEMPGTITAAIVGEQCPNLNTSAAVVFYGSKEECHCRSLGLIGQNLGERCAGVVVDGDMNALPANPAYALFSVAVNAMAGATDTAQPLDIQVQ